MSSIASAPGWKARFADGRVVTLVCWALVEDGQIVGVIQRAANEELPHGWLGFADDVDGFDGYVFTGLATRDAEV